MNQPLSHLSPANLFMRLPCFNPDQGRPIFKDEHHIIGHQLSQIANNLGPTGNSKDRDFAIGLIRLLRTDSHNDRLDPFWEYCTCYKHAIKIPKSPSASILLSAWKIVKHEKSHDPEFSDERMESLQKQRTE